MLQNVWKMDEALKAQEYFRKRMNYANHDQIFRELVPILGRSYWSIKNRFLRCGKHFVQTPREKKPRGPRAKYYVPTTHVHTIKSIDVPAFVWEERDRAIDLGHQTTTALLLGDPLPGRSALDQIKHDAAPAGVASSGSVPVIPSPDTPAGAEPSFLQETA